MGWIDWHWTSYIIYWGLSQHWSKQRGQLIHWFESDSLSVTILSEWHLPWLSLIRRCVWNGCLLITCRHFIATERWQYFRYAIRKEPLCPASTDKNLLTTSSYHSLNSWSTSYELHLDFFGWASKKCSIRLLNFMKSISMKFQMQNFYENCQWVVEAITTYLRKKCPKDNSKFQVRKQKTLHVNVEMLTSIRKNTFREQLRSI